MENRINQIMTLNDNKRYFIFKQAHYKNKNYFIAILLDNLDNFTNNYQIFEEYIDNGIEKVKKITDESLINLMIKYL